MPLTISFLTDKLVFKSHFTQVLEFVRNFHEIKTIHISRFIKLIRISQGNFDTIALKVVLKRKTTLTEKIVGCVNGKSYLTIYNLSPKLVFKHVQTGS